MMRFQQSISIFVIFILCLTKTTSVFAHTCASEYEKNWACNLTDDVYRDFYTYFEPHNLLWVGNTFIVAGVLANTGLDRSFQDSWQTNFHNSGTNSFFNSSKWIGGLSYYYFPVYLGAMIAGHLKDETLTGNVIYTWGYRSLRTFLLGGVQQVVFTKLLGGGRPSQNQDSKWQPFKYNTAVSGHAMYGAIPFLTAAMMTDPPLYRYTLYVLSTLPALSRINSNSHYLSQVLLGWAIAYFSAKSVYRSDLSRPELFQVGLQPVSDGAMVCAHLQF